MKRLQALGRFSLLSLLFVTLVFGSGFSLAQASPSIHGELLSEIQIVTDSSHALAGQQRVDLTLEEHFGNSAFYVGLTGAYSWPKTNDNKQWFFDLDEAYLDYYGKDLDLRFGKQRINWGTALQINPTSVLNPMDISDPFGDKLPVYALNLDYYLSDQLKLTGVYVPFFRPALDKIPGNPQIPVVLPEAKLENGELALRLASMGLGGFDASLSYFRGKEDLPTPRIVPGQPPQAIFRDVQVIGADLAGVLGEFGVWAEAAYSIPEDGSNYFQGVVGGDYGLDNGLILVGQYFYQYKDKKSTNLLILAANQTVGLYQWRMGVVYNLGVKSFMLNPELSYSLADATELLLGARYFGSKNGPVGMLPQEQNQVYLQLKVSF